ncbi:Peptidase M1 N-terminal domain [Popillia japonica]|uniref:Peptidase M1 N-terminal domain n=1 Tax=Popillia japonica TaxID=7064 RepID=A0AAW1LG34_POPJA
MAPRGLSPNDPSSYSRPDQIILTNIFLALDANFERKIFSGNVDLSVKKINEDVKELILDSKDLNIDSIYEKETGRKLNFTISSPIEEFGSKVSVELPPDAPTEFVITIQYETSPNASGLQWLRPEQTAGKQHPYVFSQFQAIAARSFLPCQDTPFVKTKYQAVISVPDGLTAVMSAICDSSRSLGGRGNRKQLFHFVQDIPIPAYLIAIAIGALESRDIGPRSKVWSEKEVVDDAAYEFANTEHQLRIAEEICGPYVWGRYDLLVLPPSFPFGGMENPCLTFVTPTVLAGDRSLANVVAHEISHSWTGNLVTNANFEHFWLNEGFTMLIERKIIGRLENEHLQDFEAYDGLQELKDTIKRLGEDNPLTQLVVNLTATHPDDAFSIVPYEKGQLFLRYLERIVGGPEHFEPFLRKYFDTFKYKSITTDTFRNFYESNFAHIDAIKEIDWQTWLYSPGFPPEIPEFDMSYVKVCTDFSKRFIEWDGVSPIPFTDDDVKSLRTEQLIHLLQKIIAEEPQSIEKLRQFEDKFGLKSVKNAEIKYRWLRIGLQSHWEDKIGETLDWLVHVGRMKYARPLYRALYDWEVSRQRAIDSYTKNKDNMMHVLAYTLSKDLKLSE